MAQDKAGGGRFHWPKITRDTVLLLAGIGLTIHEAAIREGPERPYMLMLFAGMMGLPVFLRQDEKRKPPSSESGDSAPSPASPTKPPTDVQRVALRLA